MDSSVQRESKAPAWVNFAAVAAVMSAWLIVRPYGGIRHDARLYFAQAIFGNDPAFLASDLLIANDQQMQFSVYGRLIHAGLHWLDPGSVAVILTALGLVLWVVAASLLGRSLSRRWWWLIALIIPLGGTSYGPHGIFLFAEGYAAPRGVAEAIVVVAIAFAVRHKVWLGFGLAAAAALVHPLVAVSGLIAVVCIAAVNDRRWRILVAVAFPAAVLAIWVDPLGIGGADSFDAAWLHIIEVRSPQIFLRTWDERGWELAATAAILLAATARHTSHSRVRTFCIGILGAGTIGMIGSWILADSLGSVFGAQLQLWRTVWLAQLGVGVAVALAVGEALAHRFASSAIRLLLVVLMVSLPPLLGGIGFVAAAASLGFLLLGPSLEVPPRTARLAIAVLTAAVIALGSIQLVSLLAAPVVAESPRHLLWSIFPSVMPIVTLAGGLVLAALVLAVERSLTPRVVSSVALVALVLLAAISWDDRSPWTRFVEGDGQPSLATASGSVVLVEIGDLGLYSLLARPVYFNLAQGAGVVFSRDLALEYEAHRANAALIDFRGSDPNVHERTDTTDPPIRTRDGLVALCARPGAPNTVLLRSPVPGAPGSEWLPPHTPNDSAALENRGVTPSDRFFRYECGEILLSKPSSG